MTGWSLVEADRLDAGLLRRLFDNEIAAVRVPGFVAPRVVATVMQRVRQHAFDFYRDVEPPIGRIGITQYEHRHDEPAQSRYFGLARQANERRRRLFAGVELFEAVLEQLRSAWPAHADLAEESEATPYFAGLVRLIDVALLHCDWAPAESPGWRIGSIDAQITWNLYCSTAETGGVTVVYRRPWTPDAEAHAVAGSYGYHSDLIRDVPAVRIEPRPADLVLFNSRNFHAVERSAGTMPRITVSSFLGRTPDRSVIAWS